MKKIADELVKPERTIEQRVKALEEGQAKIEKQMKEDKAEILKRLEKVE
jgi:chaperonin cofactor prefoldin